jgi:hypothetical protein
MRLFPPAPPRRRLRERSYDPLKDAVHLSVTESIHGNVGHAVVKIAKPTVETIEGTPDLEQFVW